jgi:hypothetical protein
LARQGADAINQATPETLNDWGLTPDQARAVARALKRQSGKRPPPRNAAHSASTTKRQSQSDSPFAAIASLVGQGDLVKGQ